MARRSDYPSGRGAGAMTVLIGEATPYSSTTPGGDGPGPTAASTLTPPRASIDTAQPIARPSTTKCTNVQSMSARMSEKDAGRKRNIAAAGTTAMTKATITVEITVENTTTGKPDFTLV